MSYQAGKPKSAAKITIPKSKELMEKVLKTLEKNAIIIGSTLGPFGQPVLIEHAEIGGKAFVTKDGVTVAKNLGYDDSIEQVVYEAALDSTIRTAQDAGDGTTTSSILSYSIAKQIYESTQNNKDISPQRLIREVQALIPSIENSVDRMSLKVNADNYDTVLHKVALLSANGDKEIADLVMNCYDQIGAQGNVALTEAYGNSGYEIEKIDGFSVDKGYEESCENFYSLFINDPTGSRVHLEKPIYWLFDGIINDISALLFPAQILESLLGPDNTEITGNVVVFAHGFSKSVLSQLAYNFSQKDTTIKILPVQTSQTIVLNSRTQFLYDVAAFTGAKVFNPMSNPIQQASTSDLIRGKSEAFESQRYKSLIMGNPDPTAVQFRVDELRNLISKSESVLDRQDIEVRISKLTCGIARIKVVGPSQIEIRERKDRVEDAWAAIRSAIKHGALPGGGWALVKMAHKFNELSKSEKDQAKRMAKEILSKAFLEPFETLYRNAGYSLDEIEEMAVSIAHSDRNTFDLFAGKWVPITELLDSAPAVMEAIRNSISTATMLGTLGGVVVFRRNKDLDTKDYRSMIDYQSALHDGESTATMIAKEEDESIS